MIRRTIFTSLSEHLRQPEITLITGSRQVGKTTLMHQLADALRAEGDNPCAAP